LAHTATDGARPEGRRLLVAFDEGEEGGRMARYFRSLGWTVDLSEPSSAEWSVQPHDLAIIGLAPARDGEAAGFERLQAVRRQDPEATVIVLGDLSPAREAEARALGARAIVPRLPYLPDLGHLAFSLTGLLHG
jgi:hypothetical protein